MEGEQVTNFAEKPQTGEGWISGGFFVFNREVLDLIEGDATLLEQEPMTALTQLNQLMAYRHEGFWQPMDTLREKNQLEAHWKTGNAPWKIW